VQRKHSVSFGLSKPGQQHKCKEDFTLITTEILPADLLCIHCTELLCVPDVWEENRHAKCEQWNNEGTEAFIYKNPKDINNMCKPWTECATTNHLKSAMETFATETFLISSVASNHRWRQSEVKNILHRHVGKASRWRQPARAHHFFWWMHFSC
jgi:hypothetical protein